MPKDYDPNKETPDERLARKKQERQAYLEAERRRAQEDEKEYQPRDKEELRNAEAEDRKFEENLIGIMKIVDGMSDQQFNKWVSKNTKAVKKAGGKARVKKEFAKKKGCAVVAVALIGGLITAFGGVVWGAVELAQFIV